MVKASNLQCRKNIESQRSCLTDFLCQVDLNNMDEEGKMDLVKKYLGFKELVNKIDKDDDEYDDDGNIIPQVGLASLFDC